MATGCGDPDRDYGMLSMILETDNIYQDKQLPDIRQSVVRAEPESSGRHRRLTSAFDQGRLCEGRQMHTNFHRDSRDVIGNDAQNAKDIVAASMMMKTALKLLSDGGCILSAAMLADAVEYLDVSIMQHTASRAA